uniref:Uncharacterized protein n=1 Tax=Callorhinchus milii TaxID=7868 RepID=A0A4W3HSA8_CALMI
MVSVCVCVCGVRKLATELQGSTCGDTNQSNKAHVRHFYLLCRSSPICALLFSALYIFSYLILTKFKKNADFTTGEIDCKVNRPYVFVGEISSVCP